MSISFFFLRNAKICIFSLSFGFLEEKEKNVFVCLFVFFTVTIVQEFDPTWFLPPSSYLRQWFEANSRYFPTDGERCLPHSTLLHCTVHCISLHCTVHCISLHGTVHCISLHYNVYHCTTIYITALHYT